MMRKKLGFILEPENPSDHQSGIIPLLITLKEG